MTQKLLTGIYATYQTRNVSRHFLNKIQKLNNGTNNTVNENIVRKFRERWSDFTNGKLSKKWLEYYISFNGIETPDYVPEDVYFTKIEPILNESQYSIVYSDKNFYDLLYPRDIFPETVLRNINGLYFDRNYNPVIINNSHKLTKFLEANERFILKPSLASGGGKNVQLYIKKGAYFVNQEDKPLDLKYLDELYGKGFLFQKMITNHPFLAQFNNTSLNTFRINVLRSPVSNQIKILQSFLRVGGMGSYIDNITGGGQSIGVTEKGELMDFAIDKINSKSPRVNNIDLPNTKYKIPYFDRICNVTKEIARRNIHDRILGLDITLDRAGLVRCIEINNDSIGINHCQLLGGPMFGDLTPEVIEYCKLHREEIFYKHVPLEFKRKKLAPEF
jgi:Sugar-transfer associated ATP-grasp